MEIVDETFLIKFFNEKRGNMVGYSNLSNQSVSIKSMTVRLCSKKSKNIFFVFFQFWSGHELSYKKILKNLECIPIECTIWIPTKAPFSCGSFGFPGMTKPPKLTSDLLNIHIYVLKTLDF